MPGRAEPRRPRSQQPGDGSGDGGGGGGEGNLLLGLEASSMEVLEQYNALLGQTEKERDAFFAALGDLRVGHQETYWLDMNLALLKNELWRCQQDRALLDDQVQAQVGRSLALKQELQRLEEQGLEDRVRIQRLLSLPQGAAVGRDVTIVLPADAEPFPLGGAAGAGRRRKGTKGERGLGGASQQQEEGQQAEEVGEEGRKRRQAEWVARALRSEKDPRVAQALRGIQAANEEIARAKAGYEREVVELQRQRSVREVEADRALAPVLGELEGAVKRMGENERQVEGTVREYLQLILDGQAIKAQTLAEHAALARAREQALSKTRGFKARLARAAKEAMVAATTTEDDGDEEEQGRVVQGLKEELAAIEADIAAIHGEYEEDRPRMEAKLASLNEALDRRAAALAREKRRYRMDNEGYENDVRNLTKEVERAKRLEERLRLERRRARQQRRREEEEEDGEGEEEEDVEGEEEEDERAEELDDLLFQLNLLLNQPKGKAAGRAAGRAAGMASASGASSSSS